MDKQAYLLPGFASHHHHLNLRTSFESSVVAGCPESIFAWLKLKMLIILVAFRTHSCYYVVAHCNQNAFGGLVIVANQLLHKEHINEILFQFLQSVYLFEKREIALFSVSWDEVYLLQLLARNNPMTVTELAKKLKVKKFTASRMVTRMADQQLVFRKQSTEDRRLVEVSITQQGYNKIDEIETFNYQTILNNIASLGENQVLSLVNSIKSLDTLLGLEHVEAPNNELE